MPEIQTADFRVVKDGVKEAVFYRPESGPEVLVGSVAYHFKVWRKDRKGHAFSFRQCRILEDGSLAVSGRVPGLGTGWVQYRAEDGELHVSFQFEATADAELGFYAAGIDPPSGAKDLRIMPGVYCGWSHQGYTFAFSFNYDDVKGVYQTAPTADLERVPWGTTLLKHERLCWSFPPSYRDGVVELKPGQRVTGSFAIKALPCSIWDPACKALLGPSGDNTIAAPRFPLARYISNWRHYLDQPDLWVRLAKDQELHTVGFYNHLDKPKRGGPYGYMLDGKRMQYGKLAQFIKSPGKKRKLSSFQDNNLQLELAWGNGGNAMAAYALSFGRRSDKVRARKIARAILHFKDGGFQLKEGPIQGAWIGAYDATKKRFQDHYGGQQVFLPDQGIINYFLAKAFLEGHTRDKAIIDRVGSNCEFFLSQLKQTYGCYPNAFALDGSIGYSREGYRYDWSNAVGVALTSLSFLMLYELTGERSAWRSAKEVFDDDLVPLLEQNAFGFVEYDHKDFCSAGACWLIIALAEFVEKAPQGRKRFKEYLDKVFQHLMSFRHEHDYFFGAHSKNTLGWHAIPHNRYGFVHGCSAGSAQGRYCLHLRYEYQYALFRMFEMTGSAQAYAAFMNYLNLYTWHQFVNQRLTKGFGGITEHIAMSKYVQATTHFIHSCPLGMLMAEKWPIYLAATSGSLKGIRFVEGGLELNIVSPESLWLSFAGGTAENVEVLHKGVTVYRGKGEFVDLAEVTAGSEIKLRVLALK